jgi:hypothetical protein
MHQNGMWTVLSTFGVGLPPIVPVPSVNHLWKQPPQPHWKRFTDALGSSQYSQIDN